MELRRAARLQPVIRPASRDQIRCRAVRQRQSDPSSEASRRMPTTNGPERQASFLLQSLTWLRSARPSSSSPGKGSDAQGIRQKHLEASRSIFSSQCRQNRHQAFRPMQTCISSKDICLIFCVHARSAPRGAASRVFCQRQKPGIADAPCACEANASSLQSRHQVHWWS